MCMKNKLKDHLSVDLEKLHFAYFRRHAHNLEPLHQMAAFGYRKIRQA